MAVGKRGPLLDFRSHDESPDVARDSHYDCALVKGAQLDCLIKAVVDQRELGVFYPGVPRDNGAPAREPGRYAPRVADVGDEPKGNALNTVS